ncbi:hypothetical protein [Salinibacter ruber]|jgi:hypothetical protein|nr:hypothetical protein [Salinibacter ruber]
MSDDTDNGSEPKDKKKVEPPDAPTNRQRLDDTTPDIEADSDPEDG